ncbi:MAG TPA: methyltransferase [Candidatus Acidoferrum sp.]|nr:methyltransferase [Candidatus Acidoferrum sp.]
MYAEGKAKVASSGAFLNPKAKFLRDLSVAFIAGKATKKTKLLDATSGTGIRGIRYYMEAGGRDLTMLDINPSAYRAVKRNVAGNKVKAKVINTSIQEFANATKEKFDFIDVDPFGGIAPYVYDIMKISRDGTYLMLTSTDSAVLCGAQPEACMKIYGAKPMHNELCHEAGIRIMIGFVTGIAAQFNFGVDVKMAIWNAHYMRLFLRLEHGSSKAVASVKKMGYLHYCRNCLSRSWELSFVPKNAICKNCKSPMVTAGRMWLGRLYDKSETSSALRYFESNFDDDETALVRTINDEYDAPFFYSIPVMTKKMGIESVSPAKALEGLHKKGHIATKTQFDYSSIKTNADISTLEKCIKAKK